MVVPCVRLAFGLAIAYDRVGLYKSLGPLTFRTAPPLCYHKNTMFSSTSSFRSNHEYDLDTRTAAIHCGTLIDVQRARYFYHDWPVLNGQE